MSRAAYEIRAVGEVPRSMLEDFEGVTVSIDPAGSTIHAELVDDAALHGLLAALRRGGFSLSTSAESKISASRWTRPSANGHPRVLPQLADRPGGG